MLESAIPFPQIDPVIFKVWIFSVRWYGLAYVAGLALAWAYMRALLRNGKLWSGGAPMRPDRADDFLIWAMLGTVAGGRLGFVLFYEPRYFIEQPLKVFYVWDGGMAFHGGLLGVGLAIWLFCRLHKVPVRSLMDLSAAVVPFGLFFGRIANFINGEIYGRLTNVPWAVDFPASVMLRDMKGNLIDLPGPRHPTQLYEAFLEGIVMFAILRVLTHRYGAFKRPGLVTGTFLIAYALFRIFAEYFKEWDIKQTFTYVPYFSEGMIYSLPMIALGLYFCWQPLRRAREAAVA
jgi:phosphatidylglycerol:prolipoprotein diacylglycerol transferase